MLIIRLYYIFYSVKAIKYQLVYFQLQMTPS